MTKFLRLLVAAVIVILPGVYGWYGRSPWIIPLLGVLYAPLYFMGKAAVWDAFRHAQTRSAILRDVPSTLLVQCLLVSVFYLVGLGLSTLFSDRSQITSLTLQDIMWLCGVTVVILPITFFIAYRERNDFDAPKTSVAEVEADDEGGEFATLDRTVTPTTFYRGVHYSRPNFTRTALVDILDHNGEKPVRVPKFASEAMIADTEARIGVRLPKTLHTIYKIQDGGSLPPYFVPKFEGASRTYENWASAFADDCNDLLPLARLETLHHAYMEGFNPEYSDPAEKDDWIPGSEKLVILAARTGYGTALDYRKGPEPGVLLFDNNINDRELMHFESFDAFLAALREVQFDYQRKNKRKDVAFGKPPNPLDPDRFWEKGNAGAAITPEQWADAGKVLGVHLPRDLLPLYEAANGGLSAYRVALAETEGDVPLHVFPTGPYVKPGLFSKLDQFVSLASLSDRLHFVDNRTPWRNIFEVPEKLIVISAAFDSAILLDYRGSDDPTLLAIEDIDNPDTAIVFPNVKTFLGRLRQFGIPTVEAKNEIGDDRISARSSDTGTFWMPNDARAPVASSVLTTFIETWDYKLFGLPKVIKAIYEQQNGGAVRFRFAAPQKINVHGHAMRDLSAPVWVNVFPDGLMPMEDWQPFDDWRKERGLALDQSLYDFANRIHPPYGEEDSDKVKLDLFVIGDHKSQATSTVTLLDMSSDFFNRNRDIMTVCHDKETDRFDIIFGPIMCDNIHSGLHQTVKALKADV